MNTLDILNSSAPDIEKILGYHFKDRKLLLLAFVHRSYLNEHRDVPEHNERLEFLGDVVLGLLISEFLYRQLPQLSEGDLSNLRARLVNAASCVKYSQKLGLAPYMLLGKGERLNDGRGRESIMADLFEALVGAIFLDGGLEAAKSFLFGHFASEVEAAVDNPFGNPKALLQDYCQKKLQEVPIYVVLEESGPDHDKVFEVAVLLHGGELGRGRGSSKKEAQYAAANAALARGLLSPPPSKRE
jgi:ribonuclease-3